MKDLQKQLNEIYDVMQKAEVIEWVLLEQDLDEEVKELIKIKQALNKKYIEINNKIYEQNKRA